MRYLLLSMFCSSIFAQVGINTASPNSESVLEVKSSTKGILLPRVALQSTVLSAPMSTHVEGMIVYNTASAGAGTNTVFPGMYYNDGTAWIRFNPNTVKVGEMKYSFATADHKGWYLLNGRAKVSLSPTAQANATSLGFGVNIPDARDKFLKTKTGAEVLASTAGANTFSIAQANLPNVNFTGTTNNTGAHTHNVDSYSGTEDIEFMSGTLTSGWPLFITLLSSSPITVASSAITSTPRTTVATGNHSHIPTVNTGGIGTAVDRTPSYLATNVFIYLGL